MKTISRKRRIAFYVSYAAMTAGCIFGGCLFSEYRLFAYLAWYFVTVALWVTLMIEVIALWIMQKKLKTGWGKK